MENFVENFTPVDFYDDDFAFLQGRKKNFTPVVEKGSSFISDHLLK